MAFWMADSATPNQVIDSNQFDSFRSRLYKRSVGEIKERQIFFSDGAGIALFETTLELVRLTEFPSRPSRLTSLFLWPTLELAKSYHNNAPYAFVYEVRILEKRNSFEGDFDSVTYYPDLLNLEGFFQRARSYWSGKGDAKRVELLLDGTIKVVQQVP